MDAFTSNSPQRVVAVVGASRSGTSVVARGLQTLGVDLGDRLRPPSWRNPTGFYEHRALLALSRRLRRALGLAPHGVALIEPEQWRSPRVRALRREAVETIRRHFGASPLWGFKDGRTLRLLPFWREVFAALGLDVRYVLAVRNPLSVVRSRLRVEERKPFSRGLTPQTAELLWLVYVVPYFRQMAERPFVVVDYDRVMTAPRRELERIAARLDLPLATEAGAPLRAYADGFLAQELRHSRFTDEDLEHHASFASLTPSAYRWLHRLASDEAGADDAALWRDWRRLEATLADMAPSLRRIDRANRGVRGIRFNPRGVLHRFGWSSA